MTSNLKVYFVQLTLGISKCSVKLSRCRLNSSTRCLCVLEAFCLILSVCCRIILNVSIKTSSNLIIYWYSKCLIDIVRDLPFFLAFSEKPALLSFVLLPHFQVSLLQLSLILPLVSFSFHPCSFFYNKDNFDD